MIDGLVMILLVFILFHIICFISFLVVSITAEIIY